jgi:hypothetical protein
MGWFRKEGEKSFGTCALTQAGFIRVMTNEALSGKRIEYSEARELLGHLTRMEGHVFWPTNVSFLDATALFSERIFGHRQVTDAYLLGLAIREKGILVTLDKAILHLAGHEYRKHVHLLD